MNRQNDVSLPEGTKARGVYLALRDQIMSGRVSDGETLPTEQRLAESHGVSRVTVRKALNVLAGAGLIKRRAGSGTTVCAPADHQRTAMNFNTLMPQLVEMGNKTTARLLSFAYETSPDYVTRAMGWDTPQMVQVATRVRQVYETPFSHLTTYVPAHIAENYSEDDLATQPLFSLLERSGVQIVNAHQTVSATLAGPEVALALGVAVGSALLSLDRVVRDVDGSGVEYLSALYRPDMFRLEMPLTRVGQQNERHWEPAIGQMNGDVQ